MEDSSFCLPAIHVFAMLHFKHSDFRASHRSSLMFLKSKLINFLNQNPFQLQRSMHWKLAEIELSEHFCWLASDPAMTGTIFSSDVVIVWSYLAGVVMCDGLFAASLCHLLQGSIFWQKRGWKKAFWTENDKLGHWCPVRYFYWQRSQLFSAQTGYTCKIFPPRASHPCHGRVWAGMRVGGRVQCLQMLSDAVCWCCLFPP